MPTDLEILQTQPFAGDMMVGRRVAQLVEQHGIASIIETGTYYGATTRFLAGLGPTISVESLAEHYDRAMANLHEFNNIQLLHGDSVLRMPEMIRRSQRPILFFLDAHWGESWPLLGELKAIADAKIRDSVIVIHDFKVPDSDLGYDTYGGQDLDLVYVALAMDRIYGRCGSCVEFNDPKTAGGLRRGVAYFTPKR